MRQHTEATVGEVTKTSGFRRWSDFFDMCVNAQTSALTWFSLRAFTIYPPPESRKYQCYQVPDPVFSASTMTKIRE